MSHETIETFFQRMTETQTAILEKHEELEKLKATYRAELKARLGITDGENANVLDLMKAAHKVFKLA